MTHLVRIAAAAALIFCAATSFASSNFAGRDPVLDWIVNGPPRRRAAGR